MPEEVKVNKSSIVKAMGLRVTAAQVKDVVVPSDVLEIAAKKMDFYHGEMKKRHARNIKNKLKNIFMKENNDADELQRRRDLTTAMAKTKGWLDGATRYFRGCKKVDVLQKYQKEVKSDYTILSSKKYLNDLKYEEFDVNDYNLCSSECPGTYLQNCRKAYKSIYDNLEHILMVDDGGGDSLDAKYRVERDKRRSEIKGKIKKFREKHRRFKTKLVGFYKEAKDEYKEVMNTIQNPDQEMKVKIKEITKDMGEFEKFIENIEEEEAKLKFDIYFNTKGADSNLNFTSTCSGTIEELNNLYDMMVNGYVYDESRSNFSKQIKKRVKELNDDVKQGGEMSNEAAKFFTDQSESRESQKQADKNAAQIGRLIEKANDKLVQLDSHLMKFLKEAEKIKTAYEAWKKDRSSQRLRIGFFIAFAAIGVALPLFNQFLPLIDAKLYPTPSPIKPCPQ